MKTILITGATGFIGCHLTRRLQAEDGQLIAAVRKDSSQLPAQVKSLVIGEITADTDWGEARMLTVRKIWQNRRSRLG
jgi:nucleoside-diphosphate-sugar epimerase